ncbi:GNAT family N-acetyltransferase [Nocardioides bizhenqiangii]|uniref:GNAT family N-acetyltransferase n=1 Tax=Nocardioides bizhenqiangii TaxID=3095076 RepID=A0ABZ0ZSL2_9ACTN|nr:MULTISPECIES: GNAT family N-acetyltransferase [unclassified Nocardioides]MDZ5622632.1 GNAT family N-acetyltransferase [Nocardioides sp. HM23]WQQ26901.1 GNAT family N-acetyltransferase [Nocardioides sp. HM61]
MDIRVVRFAGLTAGEVYDVARLRQDVFVVEQECPYLDLDGRDRDPGTGHVLMHDEGGALLGYARVLDDTTAWRIGRVVLARPARGRGLADGVIRAAIGHCRREDPLRDVVLDAQTPLADWYAGFGFAVDGDEFLEDGIPHTPMRLSSKR